MHLYGFDSHESLDAWAIATFLWRSNGKKFLVSTIITVVTFEKVLFVFECRRLLEPSTASSDTRKEELSRALISIIQKIKWLLRKGL